MTDLFAYHAAKEQMADLRRTAGQNRLTTTASHDRWLTNSRRLISRALGRISNKRSIRHRRFRPAEAVPLCSCHAPTEKRRLLGRRGDHRSA